MIDGREHKALLQLIRRKNLEPKTLQWVGQLIGGEVKAVARGYDALSSLQSLRRYLFRLAKSAEIEGRNA